MYLDSHIHLSDPAYSDHIDYVLAQMRHLQIRACCVSTTLEDSKRTLAIAGRSKMVLPFVGIHPEFVGTKRIDGQQVRRDDTGDDMDGLVLLAEENRDLIAGIGEIGLDPTLYWDTRKPDVKSTADADPPHRDGNDSIPGAQISAFETMMSLAERLDKPVSIHSRRSLDTILEIASSYSVRRAALHWFDGNKKQLRRAVDMGFFISYGPVTVYANDKRSLLSRTDRSRILVETDGPVRFSRCFEMKSGQVTFIPSVIFAMSDTLGIQFDDAVSMLEDNARSYLGTSGMQQTPSVHPPKDQN